MTDPAPKLHVDLNGPPQTMLATLYAKALDADAPHPILDDQFAEAAVDRLEYDWARTTMTPRNAPVVAMRTAHLDSWVRQFIAAHPNAVILHLGCGLDARVFRVDPGPGIEWYDIDHPEVIALRDQIYPTRRRSSIRNGSPRSPPTDRRC